jgi:hypothetical protein
MRVRIPPRPLPCRPGSLRLYPSRCFRPAGGVGMGYFDKRMVAGSTPAAAAMPRSSAVEHPGLPIPIFPRRQPQPSTRFKERPMGNTISVRNGTPVGNASLCRTCTHARIQLGYADSEVEVRCGYNYENPRLVPFIVRSAPITPAGSCPLSTRWRRLPSSSTRSGSLPLQDSPAPRRSPQRKTMSKS